MRKYNKGFVLSPVLALQKKLDARFGRGLLNALALLLLSACLSLTACVPDGKERGQQDTGAQGGAGATGQATERAAPRTPAPRITPPTAITIIDTGQKTSPSNAPSGGDFPTAPCVLDAYFARKNEEQGTFEPARSGALKETVYVVVDTVGLIGSEITLNILDADKILTNKKYGVIPFLQNGEDKQGLFTEKVRSDNFAFFEVDFKAATDEQTNLWAEAIGEYSKVNLCLILDVKGQKDVLFFGSNPAAHSEGIASERCWLDMSDKLFRLYNDGTVMVISGISEELGAVSHRGDQWPVYATRIYSHFSMQRYLDTLSSESDSFSLPQTADYNLLLARDSHQSEKPSLFRFGSGNETPPGNFYLKRGVGQRYLVYLVDANNKIAWEANGINGPDGDRGGVAIHGGWPCWSEGCITAHSDHLHGNTTIDNMMNFLNLLWMADIRWSHERVLRTAMERLIRSGSIFFQFV